jgi:hypothetical protein
MRLSRVKESSTNLQVTVAVTRNESSSLGDVASAAS